MISFRVAKHGTGNGKGAVPAAPVAKNINPNHYPCIVRISVRSRNSEEQYLHTRHTYTSRDQVPETLLCCAVIPRRHKSVGDVCGNERERERERESERDNERAKKRNRFPSFYSQTNEFFISRVSSPGATEPEFQQQ